MITQDNFTTEGRAMARRKVKAVVPSPLPPDTKRPPRTTALVDLETAIQSLNDLFWGTRAGFALLEKATDETLDSLPHAVRSHWGVKATDVAGRLKVEGTLLNGVCLVAAVSAYEVYLEKTIAGVLHLLPLPSKREKFQIDMGSLPVGTVEQFIRSLWVPQRTQEPHQRAVRPAPRIGGESVGHQHQGRSPADSQRGEGN